MIKLAMVEIDGMEIRDAAQATAYEAQGFISQEELDKAIKQLRNREIDLNALAIIDDSNRRTPWWKIVLRKLHL